MAKRKLNRWAIANLLREMHDASYRRMADANTAITDSDTLDYADLMTADYFRVCDVRFEYVRSHFPKTWQEELA